MLTTHTAGDVLAIVHELEGSFQGDLILPAFPCTTRPAGCGTWPHYGSGASVRSILRLALAARLAVADGAMTTGQLFVLGSPPASHEALDVETDLADLAFAGIAQGRRRWNDLALETATPHPSQLHEEDERGSLSVAVRRTALCR